MYIYVASSFPIYMYVCYLYNLLGSFTLSPPPHHFHHLLHLLRHFCAVSWTLVLASSWLSSAMSLSIRFSPLFGWKGRDLYKSDQDIWRFWMTTWQALSKGSARTPTDIIVFVCIHILFIIIQYYCFAHVIRFATQDVLVRYYLNIESWVILLSLCCYPQYF